MASYQGLDPIINCYPAIKSLLNSVSYFLWEKTILYGARCRAVTRSYYRGAAGALMVYDITRYVYVYIVLMGGVCLIDCCYCTFVSIRCTASLFTLIVSNQWPMYSILVECTHHLYTLTIPWYTTEYKSAMQPFLFQTNFLIEFTSVKF